MANKLSADFQYFVSTCFEEINQVRILSALSVVYQFGDIVCVFEPIDTLANVSRVQRN